MQAEIITIGTELLLGQIVDTNAAYLAQKLASIGLNLYRKTTVGDNEERLAAAVREALSRCDVVITSGGLGPTVDDVTRQAVARATGRELVLDEDLLAEIEELFARRGFTMAENNRRQAFIPEGAVPIHNPVGTAPGFIIEEGGRLVITLPGVPREMKYLTERAVIPFLRDTLGLRANVTAGSGIIKSRVLRTIGIGESTVDRAIADLETGANPTVGLAAHPGQTDIRITARADDEAQADAMIAAMEARVRERLKDVIYGVENQTVEEVVVAMLQERRLTLAVLETMTGGLLCQRLTQAPGGDSVLRQGIVVATVEGLLRAVGVPIADWDYATPQTAVEAAANLRAMAETDLALAVIGDPDPTIDPYSEAPGTTHIALASADGVEHRSFNYSGASSVSRSWAGNGALNLIRKILFVPDPKGF